MLKLLSATPSPFARKVRIALIEKQIPFELITTNPWDLDSEAIKYNPLGKVPALILENKETIYESSFILEWLEINYPEPALFASSKDNTLKMKQIEVLADGISDAFILLFFERMRPKNQHSSSWHNRQLAKVNNGMAALNACVPKTGFCIDDTFSIADISAVAVADYLSLRFKEYNWRKEYVCLSDLVDRLAERHSFQVTQPVAQKINPNTI